MQGARGTDNVGFPQQLNQGTTMLKLLAPIVACVSLSGCASQLTAFFNRSVVNDNIQNRVATVSLSADRRTVLVGLTGENAGRFCAEPPPDSATGLKTDLDASLKAKGKGDVSVEVSGKEKVETTVVVLAERTPALDAFRTGVYALCQFHLNGAVTDAEVVALFGRLITAYEATAGLNGKPASLAVPTKVASTQSTGQELAK
jgi:hypothetical protein